MIGKIQALDRAIANDEERIDAIKKDCENRKRERTALFNALSPEEKKQFEPAPAPAQKIEHKDRKDGV